MSLICFQQETSSSSSSSSDGDEPWGEADKEGTDYEVTNQLWFWLFKFGTSLGEEIFYASMFPFWFWNVDGAVGRRVVVIWALSMFIGITLFSLIKSNFTQKVLFHRPMLEGHYLLAKAGLSTCRPYGESNETIKLINQ